MTILMEQHEALLDWTDDRVAEMKRLHAAGFSCAYIAKQLGGTTRNAVIGKISRLKLPKRATLVRHEPKRRQRETPPRAKRLRMKRVAVRRPVDRPAPASPVLLEPVEIPPVAVISLLQLSEQTCKWPIGDPLLPGFGFCGTAPLEGKSYCHVHEQRAHNQ